MRDEVEAGQLTQYVQMAPLQVFSSFLLLLLHHSSQVLAFPDGVEKEQDSKIMLSRATPNKMIPAGSRG